MHGSTKQLDSTSTQAQQRRIQELERINVDLERRLEQQARERMKVSAIYILPALFSHAHPWIRSEPNQSKTPPLYTSYQIERETAENKRMWEAQHAEIRRVRARSNGACVYVSVCGLWIVDCMRRGPPRARALGWPSIITAATRALHTI